MAWTFYLFQSAGCCGYGASGLGKTSVSGSFFGYDCAVFGGVLGTRLGNQNLKGDMFCGSRLATSATQSSSHTVCSTANAFDVTFKSDNYEYVATEEANNRNRGFRLAYIPQGC